METEKGIYYNDTHYFDVESLAEDVQDQFDYMDEDGIEVEETDLEPMFQLDADWISDRLDDDRMSEDGDEVERVRELVEAHCDFTKVNELIPKLYYPNGKKYKISKKELAEAL